jgi:hypothetical protein
MVMKAQATLLALGLAVVGLSGCHAHAHGSGSGADVHVAAVDSDPDCHGVLNCTGELIEDAVLFPFRVIDSIF